MKKFFGLIFLSMLAIMLVACNGKGNDDFKKDEVDVDVAIAEQYKAILSGKKVYLVSIGQAGEIATLNTLLENYVFTDALEYANLVVLDEITQDKKTLLKPSDVEAGSVVILVPGASGKGLGAAGVELNDEKARAEGFNARAKAGEIITIVVHLGGETRRGSDTDPLIAASMKDATLVLLDVGGNFDNYFSKQNLNNVYYFSSAMALNVPFKKLFDK